ncbi:aspartyl protease family protein [Sphingomonas sp. RP10(2022)]|uniref:Aspartyl protease family protein n=1 Tax=Sphingomonas liriopis TaxID=2949094 RepID=A0A9X2KQ90_9SPHN|nr:aspartyl protease family protein [Sphingomonas liriopis]MCP3735489.1 aspartyl protease family protein [Sphingomonas liriopis]
MRASALFSVPFRVVDGRIYVEVKVDGKGPFPFAVDTGAGGMGRADASLVADLGLALTGSGQTSDGVATADVRTVRLSSVEIGGFVRRDLEVATRDYSGKLTREAAFAGILGREFFADGLLVIDYPAQRLTFSRGALAPGQEGVLAYERPFRVPVTIGGVATEGNLDTGANVTFVLPKPLFDRVGAGAAIREAGAGKLTNTIVRTGSATVAGPFRIGAETLADVEVRVSDRYPELLVGAHALQHFRLLIDQRSKSVALCPPAASSRR